jgi:cyclin B
MDWLVDLQESFALCHETLYLAVKIVDLYLTKSPKVLQRDRLQLVGITAIFIASKYEVSCLNSFFSGNSERKF